MSDPWEAVDPEMPLLLVPVRVETRSRYAGPDDPEPDSVKLCVRIYPDDLATTPDGRARLLPTTFRVLVWQGGRRSEAEGLPVRLDDIGVNLGSPGSGEGAAADAADAAFGEGAAALRDLARGAQGAASWLGDYAEAVERGLGVTVTLAGGAETVDTVYVIGVRTVETDPDPDAAAAALQEALEAHGDRALVAAGTPTNNTEAARAGWSNAAAESAAGALDAASELARALGLADVSALTDWSSTATSPSLAGSMASALWPVTWGAWLGDTLRSRLVGPYERLDLHEHVVRHVRPEGPFPTLRVGRQPYGVLPVTIPDAFSPFETGEQAVARAVKAARPFWDSAAPAPTVADGDLRTVLPKILGLAPASRNVRVRRMLRTDSPLGLAYERAGGLQADAQRARIATTRELERQLGLAPSSLRQLPHLGPARMLGLPLTAENDVEVLAALAQDHTVAGEESVLQVLLTVSRSGSWARARSTRAVALRLLDGGEELAQIIDSGDADSAARARDEAVQQLVFTILELRIVADDPDGFVRTIEEFVTADLLDAAQQVWREDARMTLETLRERAGSLAVSTRRSVLSDRLRLAQGLPYLSRARELLAALLEYLEALDVAGRVCRSLDVLSGVGDADQRERLLAGAMDVASHRLDAWVTSLATRRLRHQRAARPTGITLGAYAWLGNMPLRPAPAEGGIVEADGVGWMQAPSPTHAATAAVLRSARLTHAPGDGADSPLEIDLSSTRTREAVDIVRGMRHGQQLGALLGYRFERWMHEADPHLNRFLLVLRALAPLVVGRETPTEGDDPAFALTAAVIDGAVLLDKRGEMAARLAASDVADPPGAPPLAALLPRLEALVSRLDALADAVADLMLAEGVHQLVSGDPARATAAMNALSGDVLPEEPDIPDAPAEKDGATHRLLTLGAVTEPGDGTGWVQGIAGAAHPFLERWCRGVLGRADRIAVLERPGGGWGYAGLLRLSALEFVLAADGTPEGLERFWARMRRRRRSLPVGALRARPAALAADRLTLGEAWEIASVARGVLATARAVAPDDLVASGAPRSAARHVPDDAATAARLDAAVTATDGVMGPLPESPVARDVASLLARADALAAIGVGLDTDPATFAGEPLVLRDYVAGLVSAAGERRRRATAALAPAEPGAADRRVADIAAALAEIVGAAPVVVALAPPVDPGMGGALLPGDPGPAPRRFVARMAAVRPAVVRWATLSALRRATGRGGVLRAAVFGADRWVAEGEPAPPDVAVTSIVIDGVGALALTEPIGGLVVDGWTEHRPALRLTDPATGGTEPLVATGLTVHAPAPGARAPQAMLLGVSPDGKPWTEGRVIALLGEVQAELRMRLVTPGDVPDLGELMPAVSVGHWSTLDEYTIDPSALLRLDRMVPTFVKGS